MSITMKVQYEIDNYVNIKKSPISFLYTSNNRAENKMKTYPFTAIATTNA